jgi:hypothetical protein
MLTTIPQRDSLSDEIISTNTETTNIKQLTTELYAQVDKSAKVFGIKKEEYQNRLPDIEITDKVETAAFNPTKWKFMFNPQYISKKGAMAEEATHFLRCLFENNDKTTDGRVDELFGSLGRHIETGESTALSKEYVKKLDELYSKKSEEYNQITAELKEIDQDALEKRINTLDNFTNKLWELNDIQDKTIFKDTLKKSGEEDNYSSQYFSTIYTALEKRELHKNYLIVAKKLLQNKILEVEKLYQKSVNAKIHLEFGLINDVPLEKFIIDITKKNLHEHNEGYQATQDIIDGIGVEALLIKYPNLIRMSNKEIIELDV